MRHSMLILTNVLLLAGLPAAAKASRSAAPERQSLARAAEYLWAQQADDGSWRSPRYGVLRSGQALTPYVLHALLQVPEEVYPRPRERQERAFRFLRKMLSEHGHLGHADPELAEYPVYSTAYAMRCLLEREAASGPKVAIGHDGPFTPARSGRHLDRALLAKMQAFLASAQFSEANGFSTSEPAYGGWGFDKPSTRGDPGHMDLAHTRRALEALASLHQRHWTSDQYAAEVHQPMVRRAETFLRLVQKNPDGRGGPLAPFDGGFYFSPVVDAANKGRTVDDPAPHFRSYATATCDGLLALLAADVPRDDLRLTSAIQWLRLHSNLEYPQGVPTDHPEPWGEAIRFYHYSVRAEVYRRFDFPAEQRAALAALVAKSQRPDGSFVNEQSPLMKEDDPVLCTTLAVVALANCMP